MKRQLDRSEGAILGASCEEQSTVRGRLQSQREGIVRINPASEPL